MKTALQILIFAIAAMMLAQQVPTFTSKVNVVSLLATVHDHDGRVVKDLPPDDFVLKVDGILQTIHYFSQEADLPLTVGLLVDTSRSQTGVLEPERRAPICRPLRAAVIGAAKEHGKLELERMARETGGASYEVTKSQTIAEIFSQIEDALRNQYSIGFTPRSADDGKYHKIKLTTRDRHLVVNSRDGYYAQ